jgi:hypothetical protein
MLLTKEDILKTEKSISFLTGKAVLKYSFRFPYFNQPINLQILQNLLFPVGHVMTALSTPGFCPLKMQPALVLGAEAHTARHDLHLRLRIAVQADNCTDGTPVPADSLKFKSDPVISVVHIIFVNQQVVILVGNYNVEHSPVPEVSYGNSPAVKLLIAANILCHIPEMPRSVIEPDPVCQIRSGSCLYRPVFISEIMASLHHGNF